MPVLAAGGIGRGRQLAAALALGAARGLVRLRVAHHRGGRDAPGGEAEVPRGDVRRHHPVPIAHRQARPDAQVGVDRASGIATTHPTRSACRSSRSSPLDAQQRINRAAHTPGSGAEKLANYFVGQIVGSMNHRKSAAQVVMEMIDEYIDVVHYMQVQLES